MSAATLANEVSSTGDAFARRQSLRTMNKRQIYAESDDDEEDEGNDDDGDDDGDDLVRVAPARKRRAVEARPAAEPESTAIPVMSNDTWDALLDPDCEVTNIVADWIDKFLSDASALAVTELLNFVLKSAGCERAVETHEAEDTDTYPETLAQLEEEQRHVGTRDYPLVSKATHLRRFRKILTTYVHTLVTQSLARESLYERDLFASLMAWLAPMSTSGLRAFRHTAVVIALQMLTSLSGSLDGMREQLRLNERQLTAEERKSRSNKQKLDALKTRRALLIGTRDRVVGSVSELFDTVFVLRYRDVDTRIRVDCAHELGVSMACAHDTFLDPSRLRYAGWQMSDTAPTVRATVIRALDRVYAQNGNMAALGQFTERFCDRMVQMARRDSDNGVRAATIRLLATLRTRGLLESNQSELVCKLVYDSALSVRRAAFSFLIGHVDDIHVDQMAEFGDGDFEDQLRQWVWYKITASLLAQYNEDAVDDIGEIFDADDGASGRMYIAAASGTDVSPALQNWSSILAYASTVILDSEINADARLKEHLVQFEHTSALYAMALAALQHAVIGTEGEQAGTHVVEHFPELLRMAGTSQAKCWLVNLARQVEYQPRLHEPFVVMVTTIVSNVLQDASDVLLMQVIARGLRTWLDVPSLSDLVTGLVEKVLGAALLKARSLHEGVTGGSEGNAAMLSEMPACMAQLRIAVGLCHTASRFTDDLNDLLPVIVQETRSQSEAIYNESVDAFALHLIWQLVEGSEESKPHIVFLCSKLKHSMHLEQSVQFSARLKSLLALLDVAHVLYARNERLLTPDEEISILKVLDQAYKALAAYAGNEFEPVLEYDEEDMEGITPDPASREELEHGVAVMASSIARGIATGWFSAAHGPAFQTLQGHYGREHDRVLAKMRKQDG